MIMIFLTSADKTRKVRQFTCGLESVEAVFDFLNEIVAMGDTLVSAYILDQLDHHKCTHLPLEAFDGTPASTTIKSLEAEWRHILEKAQQPASPHQLAMIPLLQRRNQQYKVNIANSERMINHLTGLLYRTQSGNSAGATQDRLIQQYESSLKQYEEQLAKIYARSESVSRRLEQVSM